MKKNNLYYILGLGKTGLSVVRYLKRSHQRCEVFDDKISLKGIEDFQAEFPNILVHLHENPQISAEHLAEVHEVIISPGVPLTHPIAVLAREKNISIVGDIELFARHNNETNKTPIVAITGTNGKSTVTALVGEMAKAAGLNVLVGGNIGAPVLDFVGASDSQIEKYDWIILELSSFQLDSTFSLHPNIACILNITPDHLDRYVSFDAYAASKHRIYNDAHHIIFCEDDVLTKPVNFSENKGNIVSFGLDNSKTPEWNIPMEGSTKYLSFGTEHWLDVNELKIKGTHNWSNALAALAMGQLMDINPLVLCETLREFPGLDHRCQWVRELNQVNWYNDSKGTNVGATLSAIKGLGDAISGKIILLLGGQSKDADFADLRELLKKHVRSVILYGQDADKIEGMLRETVPIMRVKTFDEAIHAAQKEAHPHDVVLLSPACASWDMFDNYEHRGRVFVELVKKLA